MNSFFTLQSDHPLFRYFTEDERHRVEAAGRVIRIASGGYLIRASEIDSTLFAVEDGLLEIIGIRDGAPATLASVGPGDVLGEVSFIDDSPRTVSARAAEDTSVRAWEKPVLLAALNEDPQLFAKFSVALNELLVERLRDAVRRQGSFRPV